MDRRTYLGSLGATGLASVAGCLGDTLGGSGGDDGDGDTDTDDRVDDSDTVLGFADERRGDPSYPIHGEEFPSFSIQNPLAGESVSLDDFVGERSFLITYFFTSCPDGVCPMLLQHFNRVQKDAAESGYEDDIALLAVTFDPERDTPDALETYGAQQGIDYEADNWHFLRPENNDDALTLVNDTFGVPVKQVEDGEHADHDSSDHDHGEYTFTHSALVELVNDRGIVERAYPSAATQREAVNTEVIVEDTRTVVGVDE
ncbi:SCO family protein [Natrinema salifodinae]|uniref:Protein SCO1/2 n=1 Tax=Natrinema salifodinae TaxID=1202768 RepID=A0A1I0M261_9EURY|nr:SCO family protein [Natrinema salifodinae]SEV82238.1 protein SCO1/2 [Natrinema salifodinae]